MTVTVVGFGATRDYLGNGGRSVLDLPEGSTVGASVAALGVPERLVFACLVDGEQATLDRALHDGAEVTLMPPFSGG